MIDPQKLQLLARFMEHYHNMLQTAQEAAPDPNMRQELQQLQTFLRETHAKFQEEVKKFNSTVEAEIQQLKQHRDEAEKKIAEAAAQRQKQLEEAAARRVRFREVDPLLNEKLHSDLLEDFGNRDRRPLAASTPQAEKSGEVWQDWPETPALSPKTAGRPAAETLPPGVRPFARLIDPKLGEELRRALLSEIEPTPPPPRPSKSAKDVWQDWPEG